MTISIPIGVGKYSFLGILLFSYVFQPRTDWNEIKRGYQKSITTINYNILELALTRVVSHSKLFGK